MIEMALGCWLAHIFKRLKRPNSISRNLNTDVNGFVVVKYGFSTVLPCPALAPMQVAS